MEFDEPTPVSQLTLELRLATMMTGGVSLAVWMAGVARELNLLAQASQWRRAGGTFPTNSRLTTESAASLRLYAELIDMLDMIVDIDILSGTSAGGINAALLASSRVSGADLGGLRDLWLDLGTLTDLLRDPRDEFTPSLLYGDEQLYATFATQLPKLELGPFPPTEFPGGTRTPSTTLYVTTTLLSGEASSFTDSFGTRVQYVNRRGLFTFSETDLAQPGIASALALAARSSAAFPLAFEPAFVPFMEGTPAQGAAPARPPMAPYANITRPHWVADGSLLDNRPIDVLLKRICDRPARRPVRRVLLFVVPSSGPAPSLVPQTSADTADDRLGLLAGLLRDLGAITTQSIATDLRAIRGHQDRAAARIDAKLRLAELAATLPPDTRLLTPPLLTDYQVREARTHARELTDALLRQLDSWPLTSSTSAEGVPKNWEPELAAGDAEKVCRQHITQAMLRCWSQPPDQPLPERPADLARYGQPAYNIAKGSALAVAQAAYHLVRSDGDIAELAALTAAIHAAGPAPTAVDLGELIRAVCADKVLRAGSLKDAAALIADGYLQQLAVQEDAWDRLGEALVNGYDTLQRLCGNAAPAAEPGSLLSHDRIGASALETYLDYLGAGGDRTTIATKLFDLAATQRAMLPADSGIEQPIELVQVSADTRSLLAPDFGTARHKLTGMQFHDFGAFYKRSWRANDWMWGRLDGAGWLVHVLLNPRRVHWIAQTRVGKPGPEKRSQWFVRQLKNLGAPEFPSSGYQLPAVGGGTKQLLTERMVLEELAFLDDPARTIPTSMPLTALWLAQAWQRRILDEELDGLANTVIDPQPGERPDWSPTTSRSWARKVLDASPGDAKYALLNENPVAEESFLSDKRSPLMAQTLAKAAATAAAAAGSIRWLPSALKPSVLTLRTLALGGYRVVSLTKGIARTTILVGVVLLILGVATAIQSATVLGVTGLIMAGTGSYLIVLGTWQFSSRTLFALLSVTLAGTVLSLATPVARNWLFGDADHPGLIGANIYWLGEQWWRPLIAVGAIALAVMVIAAAKPGRR
ncbi:patatin-like protein [Mycobacterium simiae]|uniref:Patatin-like protein n=1 Tax=Mycobacterium simiae TaxID=1784 RepID=A0A5B1BU36_MYCSI|nr:patatin-like protein [Mycobacterium simiae]KAA1250814.1 patatin-like protein [Mycobacterium simiae]